MSTTTRRKFTREFKVEAVRLVTDGGLSVSQAAQDLDVRPDMLRRWRKKLADDPAEAFPGQGRLKLREEKVRQLQREAARLRQERDILKKALAIFSGRRP